jgi:hypothetical protein
MSSTASILTRAESDMDNTLVRINEDNIKNIDKSALGSGGASFPTGVAHLPLAEAIRYCICMNSINYRFWDMENGAMTRYQKDGKIGAVAMTASFLDAWTDQRFMFSRRSEPVDAKVVTDVFGDIPDVPSRVEILNEVLLSPKLDALCATLAAHCSAGKPLTVVEAKMLEDTFPTAYSDPLLKKAQLAISFVWLVAKENGLDIEVDLTAFADYQIPRVLRALKLLDYSEGLARKIDESTPIAANGPEERALRAASVLAIDMLSKRLGVPNAAIDHFLWSQRNTPKEPFHLCETTLY